jgi:hypothetical protein
MTLQEELNAHFDEYVNRSISRQKYLAEITDLEQRRKDEIKKEFGFRIDNRTLTEFAEHLIEQMEFESAIVDHWVDNYIYKSFPDFKLYTYSGIHDEARLICESSTTKNKMKQPDVKIEMYDRSTRYLEIKQCPVLYKATYKTADLKHYNELGNTYMLTAHTKGRFSADKVSFYTLLTPENLARLVADGKSGKLNVQKRREMGYKNAVQFDRAGLEEYFEIQEI